MGIIGRSARPADSILSKKARFVDFCCHSHVCAHVCFNLPGKPLRCQHVWSIALRANSIIKTKGISSRVWRAALWDANRSELRKVWTGLGQGWFWEDIRTSSFEGSRQCYQFRALRTAPANYSSIRIYLCIIWCKGRQSRVAKNLEPYCDVCVCHLFMTLWVLEVQFCLHGS